MGAVSRGRVRLWLPLAIAIATGLPGGPCHAHGDLLEQIGEVTALIQDQGSQPALLLKRAELYREHEDWAHALADIDAAATQGVADTNLRRGRVQLEAGQFAAAIGSIDAQFAAAGASSVAYYYRSLAWAGLAEHLRSANDLDRAIQLAGADAPVDWYYRRALQLQQAGGDAAAKRALEGLDAGIALHGPLVVLQSLAVHFERQLERWDAALHRIDSIMAPLQRKEPWLALKARVLDEAGAQAAALATRQAALQAIDALPPAQRTTRATAALQRELELALNNR